MGKVEVQGLAGLGSGPVVTAPRQALVTIPTAALEQAFPAGFAITEVLYQANACFVEVKLRTHGDAHEAIGYTKQKRLSRAALAYLQKYHLLEYTSRFDAVLIQPPDGIEYIERAFDFTP